MASAVIFDLDGTLVDAFEIHFKGFQAVLDEDFGLDFKREHLRRHYGKSGEEILKEFFKDEGVAEEVDFHELAEKRRRWVIENIDSCESLPGAKQILEGLRDRGIPLALGTTNPENIGEKILQACGLAEYFDAKAYRDKTTQGKPAPDIFLKAAEKLGVNPDECVVVEDSVYGLKAAKAAGMTVVAVTTGTHSKADLEKEKPRLLLETLGDAKAEQLIEL